MAKYAEPNQQAIAMELTKQTGLYPSDLLMMASRGNLYPRLVDGDDEYTTFQPVLDPIMFQGVRCEIAAATALTAGVFKTLVWKLPDFQTATFWSAGAPERFTIPAGFTKATFYTGFFANLTGPAEFLFRIRRNGTITETLGVSGPVNFGAEPIASGPLALTETDFFTVDIRASINTTIEAGQTTFFSMTIEEAG